MAKQTFTTGQVLTAAQMTSLQQTAMLGGNATAKTISYTLVAADAGTTVAMSNAGATTITVNTSLFAAGDIVTIYNQGAGVCTITAGTATVNTSGSLVLAQYQGGVLYFISASAAVFFQFATPASGDIEGVTAGVGISGGGTSGTVTVTNSMATAMTTSGDLIQATGSGTFARLGTGTNGQYLTTNGTTNSWASISAGGMTSLASGTLSGASVTISSISGTYNTLLLVVNNYYVSAAARCYVRLNGTASGYSVALGLTGGSYGTVAASTVGLDMGGDTNVATTANNGSYALQIFNYSGTNFKPMMATVHNSIPNSSGIYSYHSSVTAAITSIVLAPVSGSWSGGTYTLWGVK